LFSVSGAGGVPLKTPIPVLMFVSQFQAADAVVFTIIKPMCVPLS